MLELDLLKLLNAETIEEKIARYEVLFKIDKSLYRKCYIYAEILKLKMVKHALHKRNL